jgi:hypothetical protein
VYGRLAITLAMRGVVLALLVQSVSLLKASGVAGSDSVRPRRRRLLR